MTIMDLSVTNQVAPFVTSIIILKFSLFIQGGPLKSRVCVCVCLCRLLQLLNDKCSASKSFYRLLVTFS